MLEITSTKNKKELSGKIVKTFEDKKEEKANKKIGLFGLFALTGATIILIIYYPSFASSGYNAILWLLIGGLLWFIPVALCSAEMATVKLWSQRGGLYNWTMMMLGKRWGWTAIFFQWFQITIIYFVNLDFIVTGIFYIIGQPNFINPPNDSPVTLVLQREAIKWGLMIFIFALLTSFNMFGVKVNEWFTKFSLPLGILLPIILLIIFGFWAISTHAGGLTVQTPFNHGKAILPSFNSDPMHNATQLVIFSSFIVSYTGIEQSASLIRRAKNVRRNYPIAIFMVAAILIIFPILGSVVIVMVIKDPQNLQLDSGVFQTFENLIIGNKGVNSDIFGISHNEAEIIFRFICFLLVIGAIGTMNAIILEPSTGIHAGLVDMRFPEGIGKINRFKVHYNIMFLQFGLMLFWITILNFIGTGSSVASNLSFTICINLAVLTYLVSYILLFVSYLKLTLDKKFYRMERTSIIKGGRFIKAVVAIVGLSLTIFSVSTNFANPNLSSNPTQAYYEYVDIYLPTIVVLYFFVLFIPTISYQINFIRLYKKPIHKFLKSKNFNDQDIKKIWRMFKKDRTNLKASYLLAALGMNYNFINYYVELHSDETES